MYHYYLVELPVVGGSSGGILTDDPVTIEADDKAVKACQKWLDSINVDWVHEYYWPGDNYYAHVRILDNDGAIISALLEKAGHIEKVDPHKLAVGSYEVSQLFSTKDAKKCRQ